MTPPLHPALFAWLRAPSEPPPGDADWEALLASAAVHALTPWVHRRLAGRTEGPAALARAALDASARRLAARNLVLCDELATILHACRRDGVACVPLRGPAIAEALYGDVTARPIGDLDLLVRRSDVRDVGRLLGRLGFEPLEHRPGFAEAFSYTAVFAKRRFGWIVVEPHWSLAYPPFVDRFPMAGVWERAHAARVLGVETLALAREDLLLHVCLHAAHAEGGAPALWTLEIDALVRRARPSIDWGALVPRALAAGVGPLVARGLAQAQALLAAPVPAEVLAALRAADLATHPWGGRLLRAADVAGREELAQLLGLRGVRRRVAYVGALLVPSAAYVRATEGAVGRRDLAYAYVARGARIARAAARGALRLATG